MASLPPLYITDNLLKYLAIWSGTSYFSLLGICSCHYCLTEFSSCHKHPLYFLPVFSPTSNVLLGRVFNFSGMRLPLSDVVRPILLRFQLMWIMINKGCLDFNPFFNDAVILYDVSLSNLIQLFRQRLSHKNMKAYSTMPIGFMGRKSLPLIDWGSWCLPTTKEKALVNLFVLMSPKHKKHQLRTRNPHQPKHLLVLSRTGSASIRWEQS